MMYEVLEPITVKKQGQAIELQAGQVIALQEDKAVKLIEAGKIRHLPESFDDLTPEQKEAFEERAGIIQYDGKMSKEDAEKLAWCFEVCMLTETMSKLCERVKPCPKFNH